MRTLSIFATVLLSLVLAAPTAQARTVTGGWEVEYDGDGACMMSSVYDAGGGYQAAVVIGIGNNGLALSFVSERWNMKRGAVFNVDMTIDRSWQQRVKVKAEDTDTLLILFDYSRSLLNTIADGNKITLNDGNESWSFTLHGTQAAVPQLIACAKRYVW